MSTVEIQLPLHELSHEMAEMRVWLDKRRFEPSNFTCRDTGERVLVRIEFKVRQEARAFAGQFGGSLDANASDPMEAEIAGAGLPQDGVVGRTGAGPASLA